MSDGSAEGLTLSINQPGNDALKNNYSVARIKAAFYPKFDNEKPSKEIRARMLELVSQGLATIEVSLKHNGFLCMYAGREGGAYGKNSYGSVRTAVNIYVLGHMFCEAWGEQASEKQSEFVDFLELNHLCIAMELLSTGLGYSDHCPLKDYVVVIGVSQLGNRKPKFFSTPEIIAFCRRWRLPTNYTWLFSTRKSAMAFFATYDALFEEGTTTPVCKALDDIADVSVPGSIDHLTFKGEMLEGLVARIVSHDSSKLMETVLKEYPHLISADQNLGRSLKEIFEANTTEEGRKNALLESDCCKAFRPNYLKESILNSGEAGLSVINKFLHSRPADLSTSKLQEMFHLIPNGDFIVDSAGSETFDQRIIIKLHNDTTCAKYRSKTKNKPGAWPLYRGFFVDLKFFKNKEVNAAEETLSEDTNSESGLSDKDANLMLKLKFFPYNIRTVLITGGLTYLYKDDMFLENGIESYKKYYEGFMKLWKISEAKSMELSQMLHELAEFFCEKYKDQKRLRAVTFRNEADKFLEQFEKRPAENQKKNGLFVFFPGLPGSGKSVVCEEIEKLASQSKFGDNRSVRHLMDDTIQGNYWRTVREEFKNNPCSILLADKNVPLTSIWQSITCDINVPQASIWQKIKGICWTKAYGVPVVADSEGTESNPFSLDALAIFIFRVLQRVDSHTGNNLNKSSPNLGYVFLHMYHHFDGKSRKEFEDELVSKHFGVIVKMPLLVELSERPHMPDDVMSTLKNGMELYKRHHGKLECNKSSYANEWADWDKNLREILLENAEYFNSIQVPLELSVAKVMEQLNEIIASSSKCAKESYSC